MKSFWMASSFLVLLVLMALLSFDCGLKDCTVVLSKTYTFTPTNTPNCCQEVRTLLGQPGVSGNFTVAPKDLAVDNVHGQYYVADQGNNRVQVFQLNGTGVGTIGGASPTLGFVGEFTDPEGMTMDNSGNLFVGEYNGASVKKVNPVTGALITTFGSGTVGNVRALTVDTNGDVYVASQGGNIYVYQPASATVYNLVGTFNELAPIGATPTGILKQGANLFISDGGNDVYEAQVTVGTPYTLSSPTVVISTNLVGAYQMAQNSLGNIYIASYNDGTFHVYNPGFSPSTEIYSCAPSPNINAVGIGVDSQGYVYLSGTYASATGEAMQLYPCSLVAWSCPLGQGLTQYAFADLLRLYFL